MLHEGKMSRTEIENKIKKSTEFKGIIRLESLNS